MERIRRILNHDIKFQKKKLRSTYIVTLFFWVLEIDYVENKLFDPERR